MIISVVLKEKSESKPRYFQNTSDLYSLLSDLSPFGSIPISVYIFRVCGAFDVTVFDLSLKMSENIGNLYVRSESEEEVSTAQNSPKKSTSLSSLRSLRDTFKRSESRASQTSLASATISETPDDGSDSVSPVVKASKSFACVSSKTDKQSQATKLLNTLRFVTKLFKYSRE